jgi:hypothetical protein
MYANNFEYCGYVINMDIFSGVGGFCLDVVNIVSINQPLQILDLTLDLYSIQ